MSNTAQTIILWGLVIVAAIFLVRNIYRKLTKKGCGGGGSCGCGSKFKSK